MKFYLHHFNGLIDVLSLCYSVQRTLCHSEELRCNDVRIPRKGYHIKPHARYFCTCVEKKAQTSIRVSVIAPDNVISKAQLSGTPRDTVYPWGKGAHKQKSEHYRPPDNAISKVQCAPCSAILCQFICLVDTFYGKNKPDPCQRDTFRAFFNYSAIKPLFVAECLSYFRIVEKVVFVQVFFVKRLYVGLCGQPSLF